VPGSKPIADTAKYLAKQIGQTDIVLFLGAGVNEGHLPNWRSLLHSVVEHAVQYGLGDRWPAKQRSDVTKWLSGIARELSAPSPYEQASLAKRLLGSQYLHTIHQELHAKVRSGFPTMKYEDSRDMSYLGAIVNLCLSNCVHAVVTYNYDDYLEILIEKELARRSKSRSKSRSKPILSKPARLCSQLLKYSPKTQLPVYHVHGLLPRDGCLPEFDASTFVFSYDEYYRMLLEPFSWQTSYQLYFLQNYICLFLGVSLEDMNMLRLLSHAREYVAGPGVFVLWSREDLGLFECDVELANGVMNVRHALCDEFGVGLVDCGNEYADVRRVVKDLPRAISSHRRKRKKEQIGE